MLWTSLAFAFTIYVSGLVYGQDNPCPKQGSGFYPDSYQCDKYWECRKGRATYKMCPDGLVFNPKSPLYERCQYPFNIDCTDRPLLQEPRPRRHCPRSNGLFANEKECASFWQCNSGLGRLVRCQGTLAFNPTSGTCQWPHLVPGCEIEPVITGDSADEDDERHQTVTTRAPQPPPASRGRSQSRSRRPSTPAPAVEEEPPRPAQPPRGSRGQNRGRQPATTRPIPPTANDAAPEAVPVPFLPPPPVRRIPSYSPPQRNSEQDKKPEDAPALPLPVSFQPPAGVRRVPNFNQPPRQPESSADNSPVVTGPARSQNPQVQRAPVHIHRESPPSVDNDNAELPRAPVSPPPLARRVVLRRPVTTTTEAPSNEDYNYDAFSS